MKTVQKVLKRDVLMVTGSLQLCRGQGAGSEAAIHAVYEMSNKESTEAVLMVDASNAFIAKNQGRGEGRAFLHNVKILCSSILTYISNYY